MRFLAVIAGLAALAFAKQEVIASVESESAASAETESADIRITHNSRRTSHSLPLGISNGCVADEKLSASSEFKAAVSDFSAARARLSLDKEGSLAVGWRPGKDDASPWLEVDMGREFVVGSVGTQGGFDIDSTTGAPNNGMWVSTYDLTGSLDGITWDTIATNVPGNSDGDGVVTRDVGAHSVEPVRARFLRFAPTKCGTRAAADGVVRTFAAKDTPNLCALRVEVYGYSVCSHGPCHTVRPLGVGLPSKTAQAVNMPHPALLPDGALRASSFFAPSSAPYVARLNAQPRPFREGGWTPSCHNAEDGSRVCAASGSAQPEYLQVDLGRELEINAVATQGAASRAAWVQKYELAFSNDGRHWAKATKAFSGNADSTGTVKNTLPRPVLARYVRIIPTAWHGQEKGNDYGLRWELYGPQGYSQEEERAWLQGLPTRGMCRLQRPACHCDNSQAPLPLEAPGTKSTCPCRRYTLQLLSRAVHIPAVAYAHNEALDYMTAALSTLQSAAEYAAAKAVKAAAQPATLRGAVPAFVTAA